MRRIKRKMKAVLKKILPPIFLGVLKGLVGAGSPYDGEFKSWKEAEEKCTGYDTDLIFFKVLESSRAVANQEALFERDSVLFDQPNYSWSFLAALLWAFSQVPRQKPHVLDFGGSLGSTFHQYYRFLPKTDLQWTVVEQSRFVEAGNDEFSTGSLAFCGSIAEARRRAPIDIVICSSALQYIELFEGVFSRFAGATPSAIIIARTPVSKRAEGFITRQRVPSSIYEATYASHIFGNHQLEDLAQRHGFRLFESFLSEIDSDLGDIRYMGYLFVPEDTVTD